ncbi:hypothetical protein PIB30_050148 [Stylosanthes scabra]|uniref:Uncharacterized protein n=1 Tax=Stylosanthes scabra TaxID=79078 RepID=A0ABU6YIQ0_9FABA|nr:hypothetical protein [Stylosanthes scabra]
MVKEKNKDMVQVVNKYDDSNWSLSVEEDYIVFCFGEDGSLDVVKDGKSVKSVSKKHKLPNTKNPKRLEFKQQLNYADDEELQEVNEQQIHKNRSNDEEVKKMERAQLREDTELSESDQSEGSNGSFAFPVLNWECMGSPAKMPKSEEGLCQKKHQFVPFQCFRF